MINFILASASPDRKRILEKFLSSVKTRHCLVSTLKIVPANIDESQILAKTPKKQAIELAKSKALTVFEKLNKPKNTIILGADTLVAYKNEIIGKAEDKKHAREIISKLSGTWHDLITGYCLIINNNKPNNSTLFYSDAALSRQNEKLLQHSDKSLCCNNFSPKKGQLCVGENNPRIFKIIFDAVVTKVYMRKLSKPDLENYLDSGGWKNKAGAYGIQEEASEFIPKIKGCFLNVVGLPLCEINKHLLDFGVGIEQKNIIKLCNKCFKSI